MILVYTPKINKQYTQNYITHHLLLQLQLLF